ncbi:Topoisomerase 1-associated factor 1 [Paraconiothyrium brasiliense]|uniref:Topoisomerase 1-associated factor 1 n=1 Tax=Paraconiothyrium brasiliense TaxID=300254 RepID=A0ABR3S0Q6_9PLEO
MSQQTTLDEWSKDPVDPEIRAHVYSLITALGGIGDDGTYSFGDDALLCLKDLRKWLKFADGQLNRRDVARCMAEANLVKGDLLEILAKVSTKVTDDRVKHKLAVATLELLVPLTWPFQIDPVEATVNHHRHGPYIQRAQIGYKRAILQYDRTNILQTAVRIALPSMAVPSRERTPRDDGIIRIALYFIRNVVMLSPPKAVPMDIDEAEVSRSATIDTFHQQDIFQVILSVASSIGDDFVSQDVIVLEILFYLLKGIDAEKLFMEAKKLKSKNTDELRSLIQKEKSMLAGYARHAPSRHNRFGTMIWLKRGDDEQVSTISGQDVLGKAQKSMQKMDTTKKWNKPKRSGRKPDGEQEREDFDLPVSLTSSARKHVKAFVEEFLDSSFNPLFLHLRKAIEREAERVETRHSRQFFYLVSWFLRAECARRRNMKEKAADQKDNHVLRAEDESYGLVAEVMNQETFILMNRFMQKSEDEKAWQDLNAGMKCFTQILLTVQEMSESALEDDQEIAENIQNRIFYEESTHDRIVHTLRSYKDQGFGYLDAVTELAHVFLRMLERYSKQNVDMQVRSKRRARKIRKKQAEAQKEDGEQEGHISEREDLEIAQKTVSERKFDFSRFAAKFISQSSVNTFVAFTKYYNELDTDQLKRAHRFFHRVTFKMELGILLYRVDILQLFNKIVKGPEGLDPESPSFKEWDEFVRHFFRAVVKRVQDRPELIVEMLFSKIPQTMFFLEHGYDRELPKKTPRAPAELEVKPGMEKPEQIGVAVGILVNQQKSDVLHWVRDILSSAVEERKAWEDMQEAQEEIAAAAAAADLEGQAAADQDGIEMPTPPTILIKPDSEERRVAIFKDNKICLLLTLVGFARLGADDDPDATWVIPSPLNSKDLQEAIDLIRKYEFEPPTYADGKGPEDMLRSKLTAARRSNRRVDWDDDDDDDDIDHDSAGDRGEYALDEPAARKADGSGKKLLKRRRRVRTPVELDDEEKQERADARRQKEIEKQLKVKSTMFVHDSDDEDDPEADAAFFAREEVLRAQNKANIARSLVLGNTEPAVPKKRKADGLRVNKSRRRKVQPKQRAGPIESDESDVEEPDIASAGYSSGRAQSEERHLDLDDSEDEATDTPLSSQLAGTAEVSTKNTVLNASRDDDVTMADADDDEDEVVTVRRPPMRNTRAGFIVDSDSEFEKIRSQWEAAQISHDEAKLKMVGRQEKPLPHQPLYGEEITNASKFRRKLSQGLSLISLSQRRTTPVRPPLPSNDLNSAIEDPHPHESTKLLSPMPPPFSYGVSVRKVKPEGTATSQRNLRAETTPKQLPRSRAMDFIPRSTPRNLESMAVRNPRTPKAQFQREFDASDTSACQAIVQHPGTLTAVTRTRGSDGSDGSVEETFDRSRQRVGSKQTSSLYHAASIKQTQVLSKCDPNTFYGPASSA